jgi:hypothetical protein
MLIRLFYAQRKKHERLIEGKMNSVIAVYFIFSLAA